MNRRAWLQRSAMAAAILPVSNWYIPETIERVTRRGDTAVIKLNSNENPFGLSQAVRKAINDSLDHANRYPWDFIDELQAEIGAREGLTADHVLLTAGSTEILGLTGLAYGLHGGELVSFHPTFDFLLLYAEKMGCTWGRTPVDHMMQQNLDVLSKQVNKNTKLIFVCNPNNPTGLEVPNAELRNFCISQSATHPVFVDEAYIELSPNGRQSSMADLVKNNPNIIVGRTFSKVHGLAGMRIGYALAHPDTINKLYELHTGRAMTLSVPACAAALASLRDNTFEAFSREQFIEGRNFVNTTFDRWGVEYLPSATNFVFFKTNRFSADPVMALKEHNILIRSYQHTPGWARVSIGTMDEMKSFASVAGNYVNG